MKVPPITPNPTTQGTKRNATPQLPAGRSIIGIAASLAIGMILLATGAAIAVRIFCYISGVCI